jgi:hypothetical protein
MFATLRDLSDVQPSDFTFDAGPAAMYLSFDYANVPADADFQLQLVRGNYEVFKRKLPWTGNLSGTLTQLISDDPRALVPGRYIVNITLERATAKGFFNISETSALPGARLLVENFQDDLLGWGLQSDADGMAEIGEGRLRLRTKSKRGLALAEPPIELRNFDLSVDMQFEAGPPHTESTILIRDDYWFTIYAYGFFEVDSVNSGFKPLIPLRRSAAIKSFGETNRLRVIAEDEKYAFYINDILVGTFTGDQSGLGRIGFVVRDFDQSQLVSASFSNLTITLPKEKVAAQPTSGRKSQVMRFASPDLGTNTAVRAVFVLCWVSMNRQRINGWWSSTDACGETDHYAGLERISTRPPSCSCGDE